MTRERLVEVHGTWLEELGEVELIGGCAEVTLAPAFARQADVEAYEVFVTCYDAAVVFVHNRTATGFEIHAMSAPNRRRHASVRCAYRIVAPAK